MGNILHLSGIRMQTYYNTLSHIFGNIFFHSLIVFFVTLNIYRSPNLPNKKVPTCRTKQSQLAEFRQNICVLVLLHSKWKIKVMKDYKQRIADQMLEIKMAKQQSRSILDLSKRLVLEHLPSGRFWTGLSIESFNENKRVILILAARKSKK